MMFFFLTVNLFVVVVIIVYIQFLESIQKFNVNETFSYCF